MNMTDAFKKQLNLTEEKQKKLRNVKLNKELSKFILNIDIDFPVPEYMLSSFEKGKSPNLSLSCFFNNKFKETNLWKAFLETIKEHGRAVICFKSKVMGGDKSTWWCLTDSMLELPRGITGIFISAGESVDIIRVVKLKDYLNY